MNAITAPYNRAVAMLSAPWIDAVMLLFVRISLAGIFWRSGRTKVDEGSWLSVSDTAMFLFEEEYKGVPLPPEFAAYMATYAEHLFPCPAGHRPVYPALRARVARHDNGDPAFRLSRGLVVGAYDLGRAGSGAHSSRRRQPVARPAADRKK